MISNQRLDTKSDPDGTFMLGAAFEMLGLTPIISDYLILGYSLARLDQKDVVYHLADATHEFVICSVHPNTPINYDAHVFDQADGVSPLMPINVGFQLNCANHDAFVGIVETVLDALKSGRLIPDPEDKSAWDYFLPTSYPLHHSKGPVLTPVIDAVQ